MTRLASALDRLGSWTSVAVWALVILGLSSIPNFAPPSSSRELNPDKLVHFSLYFVLSALAFAAARRSWPETRAATRALFVVIAVSTFGALDEVYQHFTPGRDPNPLDWAADVAGAACGALIAAWPLRTRRDPEGPSQTAIMDQ